MPWFGVWRRSSFKGFRLLQEFPEEYQATAMAFQLAEVLGVPLTVRPFFPWWV